MIPAGRPRKYRFVYPKLEAYIRKHYRSVNAFSKAAGITPSTLYCALEGFHDPSMGTINKILVETGMTAEEAFYEGD